MSGSNFCCLLTIVGLDKNIFDILIASCEDISLSSTFGDLILFQVFNILTLCTVPFIVEADGFQFLSKHKFDFNKWVSLGIPYNNDNEKVSRFLTPGIKKEKMESLLI